MNFGCWARGFCITILAPCVFNRLHVGDSCESPRRAPLRAAQPYAFLADESGAFPEYPQTGEFTNSVDGSCRLPAARQTARRAATDAQAQEDGVRSENRRFFLI